MPVRLRLGRPRVALIVAPHPDDETIGAFGLIAALRHRATRVRVLVVSDGAASHSASPRWPRARLVRERRRETLRAMREAGIGRAAVRFLDRPDGGLDRDRRCGREVARAVRATPGLDLLVGPAPGDDHADHRAVAAALAAARLPGVRRLRYQVWPIGRRRRGFALPLPGALAMAKRRAIRAYRTQAGLIGDDPGGFAMTRRQIQAFSRPVELFEEVRPCGRSR